MRRSFSYLDQVLVSFFFIFVFSVVLLVNIYIKDEVNGLKNRAISVLEQRLNLRISYRDLYFSSWNEIIIEGMVLRESGYRQSRTLVATEKVKVSVRLSDLLFKNLESMKFLSSLSISEFSLNFFSDSSIFKSLGLSADNRIEHLSFGSSKAKKTEFNFDNFQLNCQNGKVNYYTHDVQEFDLPLASLSLDNISFFLNKTEGVFKLNGRSEVFRSLNGFSARFEMDGLINLSEATADIGVVLDRISLLGESAPDIRFLVDYRDKKLRVDSTIFKQFLFIEGSYQVGKAGKFSVEMNRDSGFFMKFLKKRAVIKSIFNTKEKYYPEGKIALSILKDDFKLVGKLSIRDRRKSIVDMRIFANSGYLDIQHLKLIGDNNFFLAKAKWFFERRLPDLHLTFNKFSLGGGVASGRFDLLYRANDRYWVSIKNAQYKGAYLGTLSTDLIFDEDGIRFDSRGSNRNINFKGFLDDENDLHIELVLNGFYLSPIAKLTGADFLKGAVLSGKMHLNFMDDEIESEGNLSGYNLSGYNFLGDRKHIRLSYLYSGNNLKIKRAFLNSPALSVSGDVRIASDKISANLNLFIAGISYPLLGYLNFDKNNLLSLTVRNWFALSGNLAGRPSFKTSFTGLPVAIGGVRANLYGKVNLSYKEGSFQTKGNLKAIFGGEFKRTLKATTIYFRSKGSQFHFQNIMLELSNRKVSGFGNILLGQNDVRLNLSLDKSIDIYLKYRSNQVLSKIVFNKFQIKNLISPSLQGALVGALELSGHLPDVSVSGNLRLINGLLGNKKAGFEFNLKAVPSGFSINRGRFYLDKQKVVINRGLVKLRGSEVDLFSLQGNLNVSVLMNIKSKFSLKGKIASDIVYCDMKYDDLHLNGNKVGSLKSHLVYDNPVLRIRRKGNSGISGYMDLKNSDFSFFYYDNKVLRLKGAGKVVKKGLDIFLKSDNLDLKYLMLLSGAFDKAAGKGKMRLQINGSLDDPKLVGHLDFKNGRLKPSFLQDEIKNFQLRVDFARNKINLTKFSGKSGKGSIYATGSAFLRKGNIEDMNIRFRTDRKEGIRVGFDAGDLKAKGKAFADVVIKGIVSSPKIIGRLAVKDNDISYMEDSSPSKDTYLKYIDWHLDITAMTGVRYYYTVVNGVLKPGTGLKLRGRIRDPGFNVKGKIEIERGTFDYINHEFKVISPTYLDFRKSPRVFDAYLNFKGKTELKDDQGNKVTVFILYAGVLGVDDLKPKFYSEPSFTEDKLQQMLGIKLESDGGDNKAQENILLESTDLISLLGLSTLVSKRVKSFLGLDVFTIRTSILRHLIEKNSLDNLDPEREMSVLRGTEFTVGKYLTSFIFVEYTLSLQSAVSIVNELIPAHKFGIDLSFNIFNVGYKFKSTEESDFSDYEHSIEVNFRKKF